MKLIASIVLIKKIAMFHGIELEVPGATRYLAADSRGYVTAYAVCKPRIVTLICGRECWWGIDNCLENTLGEVALVDLEGMDWRTTLVDVNSADGEETNGREKAE